MVTIPDIVKKTIDSYLKKLSENGIVVVKAILFGSYSTGKQTEWSDIDLAIVSKSFTGSRFEDRRKIRRITLDTNSALEVQPYSIADFSEEDPFVKEIIETGIEVL